MGKNRRWGFMRLWVLAVLMAGCPSLVAGVAWADEPSDAALRAEIRDLKNRLARLENRVAGAEIGGISSIGEKPGASTLELPSGLRGLSISGYADVSYIYNLEKPDPVSGGNPGRVFDTESGGFTPHAAELVLEKAMTSEMPFGFRTDLFFGDDAELIHATGLGEAPGTGNVADTFDLQQAYVTARAPIGDGLDFKVGKFVTLLGAEVIESPANWNFSRSYMFGYSIPFTHTGVLATYPLGEIGSTTLGVVNGWDIVDDNNQAKSLIGNLTLTPMKTLTVSLNGITGAEQNNNSHNHRTVFDSVVTWTPVERLALMANYDYGHESGLTPGTGAAGSDGVNWQGLALYAKYDVTPTWSLAGRWEWFGDMDNVRTRLTSLGGGIPTDIDFMEWTLTNQWTLHEHVLARLEYRHDKANEQVFKHGDAFNDYQDTIAAEMIYHF